MTTTKKLLSTDIFDESTDYFFSPELADAVRVAIFTQKPLIITGAPGTGKTSLANAVAKILAQHKDLNFHNEALVFNTKSVSVYTDVLYRYDQMRHFRKLQIENKQPENNSKQTEIADNNERETRKFINWGALGKAILAANGELWEEPKLNNKRFVVLFDEIDKAPRDFPNDLLDVLQDYKMEVPELDWLDCNGKKKKCPPEFKPIVIMSSNSEKSLPDAFLRRCVFHYIELPNSNVLEKIIRKHVRITISPENEGKARKWFLKLQNEEKHFRKAPATAEYIDWLGFLADLEQPFDFDKLKDNNNNNIQVDFAKNETKMKRNFKMSLALLAKNYDDYNILIEEIGLK